MIFQRSVTKIKMKKKSINPRSAVGNCLNLYKEFDEQAKEYKSACKKKCCICCYDYFYISEAEFYTILHSILQKGNYEEYLNQLILKSRESVADLKRKLPLEYKKIYSNDCTKPIQYYINPTGTDNIRLDKPCIFLNSKNKCDIYEVRPLVCRKFGTVLDSEQEYSFACKYAEYYHNIDYSKTLNYHKSNGILFVENYFRIPKPIFYWVLEILPLIRSTNYEAVTKMCELNYETYVKSHF